MPMFRIPMAAGWIATLTRDGGPERLAEDTRRQVRRHGRCVHGASSGFTLIELLVVIAIIGVLVALTIPAVQAAREAARRIDCANRIRQLALACQLHESKHRFYPSGGWSKNWVGLPELAYGPSQPGGWIYHILPDIEQSALFKLGGIGSQHHEANRTRVETPLEALHCPSRRSATAFELGYRWQPYETARVNTAARNDYAINGGAVYVRHGDGPSDVRAERQFPWPSMKRRNGICHQRSRVRSADVSDGLSNTYLLGEKHLARQDYFNGNDPGDNESAYGGDDRDLQRFTSLDGRLPLLPYPDSRRDKLPRNLQGARFGSAHRSGFQMALCDGSVRLVSYSMDGDLHRDLGDRRDGTSVTLPE